jgi:hypothetical protein
MSKYNSHKKPNLIDKIYHSASVEFWLSIVIVGIIADWILKFGVDSIVLTVSFTAIAIAYLGMTNSAVGNLWYKFKRMKAPQYLSLLLSVTILGSLFLINCMTDPAHALIVTASGESAIKGLLSGKALEVAGTAAASTAGSSASTGAAGMGKFAEVIITVIKLFFAFTFVFTLYGAYQKYQERAEIQEIIQSPVVLIIVVLAIDGMLSVILGAT